MQTMKDRADKVDQQWNKLSDADKVYFAMAIHAETFESLTERVKRIKCEYVATMPF